MYTLINNYDFHIENLSNQGSYIRLNNGNTFYAEHVIPVDAIPNIDTKYYRYLSSFVSSKYCGLIVSVKDERMLVPDNRWVRHHNNIEPVDITIGTLVTIANTIDCEITLKSGDLNTKVFRVIGFTQSDHLLIYSNGNTYTVNPYNIQPLITNDIEVGDTIIVGNGRYVKVNEVVNNNLKTSIGIFRRVEVTLYKKPIKKLADATINHNKKLPDLFSTNPNLKFKKLQVSDYNIPQVIFEGDFLDGRWVCIIPYDMINKTSQNYIGVSPSLFEYLIKFVDDNIGGKPYYSNNFLNFKHKYFNVDFLVKSKKAKKREQTYIILIDTKHKDKIESLLNQKQYKLYEETENIQIYGIEFKHIKHYNKFLRIKNEKSHFKLTRI